MSAKEEMDVLMVREFRLLEQLTGRGAAGTVSVFTYVLPALVSQAMHGIGVRTSQAGAGLATSLA